jgi:hypothetical protein
LTGEKAFNQLMTMTGGEFQLKPFTAPPQRTVQSGWENLLMEAARRFDEETVLIKKPSAPAEPPKPAAAEKSEHAVVGDDIVVVATYDGQWKPSDDSKK